MSEAPLREVLLVARREYLARVRSKAFLLSTVIIPLAFACIIGVSTLSTKLAGGGKHIVIASNDAALAESTRTELAAQESKAGNEGEKRRQTAQTQVEVQAPVAESDLTELRRQVEDKRIDGYLWLGIQPGESQPKAIYATGTSTDFLGSDRLTTAIGHALVREALMKRGVTDSDIEGLMKDVNLQTRYVKNGHWTSSDTMKSFWGAYIMTFMLYFAVVFYGMNVAQSVVAEKASRVFEVLLATVTPESLMAGKLLGVGAAGLTQMGVWVIAFLILSSAGLAAEFGAGGLAAYGVTPLQLIFFLLYFLLGFFFYSAFSAGFGATVNQESDLQQFSMLIVMPQTLALILTAYILGNPSAWPVVVLSLIPPFTPIVMCLRVSAMAVPWWQLGLSFVLMAGSVLGMLWLTSRIYRVGILMYGKRPTLPEIMRWLRYT